MRLRESAGLEFVARHQLAADETRARREQIGRHRRNVLEREVASEARTDASHLGKVEVVVGAVERSLFAQLRVEVRGDLLLARTRLLGVVQVLSRRVLRISTRRGIASRRGSSYHGRVRKRSVIRSRRLSAIESSKGACRSWPASLIHIPRRVSSRLVSLRVAPAHDGQAQIGVVLTHQKAAFAQSIEVMLQLILAQ